MSYRLGLDAQLFIGAAGSRAATELTNVKDVTLNLETGEADVTTRAANGWRAMAATLKEGSVEFEMNWDPEDTGFTQISSAFFSGNAISLFVTDGLGNGLDADFTVTQFNRSEPLEEALTVAVVCKPTYLTRAPAWVTGANSGH